MSKNKREDNFIYLLSALVIFLVLLPAVGELPFVPEPIGRSVGFVCILGIGVWSLRDSQRIFQIGIALFVIGTTASILESLTEIGAMEHIAMATMFAFLALAIRSALKQVLFGSKMDANRLYGAVCVYLMIGIGPLGHVII